MRFFPRRDCLLCDYEQSPTHEHRKHCHCPSSPVVIALPLGDLISHPLSDVHRVQSPVSSRGAFESMILSRIYISDKAFGAVTPGLVEVECGAVVILSRRWNGYIQRSVSTVHDREVCPFYGVRCRVIQGARQNAPDCGAIGRAARSDAGTHGLRGSCFKLRR
jgi:hypothetical protein